MKYACVTLALWLALASSALPKEVDFDRDVRPILSDKCFQCHGPDEATREADLRLDTKSGAFADLGGYAAFVAKDSKASHAIQRVLSDDPDEQMPPPDSKISLTEKEKQILRQWVDEGAHWSEHWAFVAPTMIDPPLDPSNWSHNEIDQFILAKLKTVGLKPSEPSSRESLLRRVTLDLTGLPPTLEEIDAFLADKSADAYDKVVDRLLASPKYAERMAWEWLEAARYADTDGFQGDPTRTMWPWRDWLIRALNQNMPFDQFTIEMLAGDLLPGATNDQILATGFNRNHMHNGEGGRIADETRVENVFDRTETTSTVWLGLTMTCCRCHDHKFDPMTQEEYFQLYAFFNNTSETGRRAGGKAPPILNYLDPGQEQTRQKLREQIAAIAVQLSAPLPELDKQQIAWEQKQLDTFKQQASSSLSLSKWQELGPFAEPTGDGTKAYDHDFGPESGVDLNQEYGDKKLKWHEASRYVDGKVHNWGETVGPTYLYRRLDIQKPRSVTFRFGSDDGLIVWLNGKKIHEKRINRAAAADQEKVSVELLAGTNELLMKIVNTGGIGGFYFKSSKPNIGLPENVAKALQKPSGKRDKQDKASIREFFRSTHWDKWKGLEAQRSRLKKQVDAIKPVTVMVMDQLADNKLRKTRILDRGAYDKPMDEVGIGTPSFLPPLAESKKIDRLAMARWLVAPENPLTARVTVNRHWQTFFAKGIVKSTEDFGSQGSRPTHPQLLDWLAVDFVKNGWDVKRLHKQFVTSATYRQSSRISRQHLELDPDNKYLARRPRYRMASWMLRDQALSVSGLLADRIGGPTVNSYQPAGIWAEATFGKIKYKQGTGDDLYRRSLYLFWRRIVGPTMFFDGGKRQVCEVKPTRTNTPLHALTTLNETTYVEASRAMAQRIMQGVQQTQQQKITSAFRALTARFPTDNELNLLVTRWNQLKHRFEAHPEEAAELLSVGESKRNQSLDASEHAAYTIVCSMLLNLDEVLSLE